MQKLHGTESPKLNDKTLEQAMGSSVIFRHVKSLSRRTRGIDSSPVPTLHGFLKTAGNEPRLAPEELREVPENCWATPISPYQATTKKEFLCRI